MPATRAHAGRTHAAGKWRVGRLRGRGTMGGASFKHALHRRTSGSVTTFRQHQADAAFRTPERSLPAVILTRRVRHGSLHFNCGPPGTPPSFGLRLSLRIHLSHHDAPNGGSPSPPG